MDITLGLTPEGAIKIKKDDPLGLRAVNCACCVTCPCPLPDSIVGKKFAVTSVSWSSIVSFSTMDACGIFRANTADGYSIEVSTSNRNPPNCEWDPFSAKWIGVVYNGNPIDEPCVLLTAFIFADFPMGTHDVIDDYGIPGSGCDDWTLTISEVP